MIVKSDWYVLHVRTGYENDIAKTLESRGFTTAVPVENRIIRRGGKWIEESYIVFTGYVFVRMNYSWNKYYAMSGIPGVIKLLGGGTAPTPISKNEVEFILQLTDLLREPSVIKFTDNDNYEIISGFLADYEDKIVKIQRRYKKAIVKITIAGEEKEFKVSFVEATEQIPVQTED